MAIFFCFILSLLASCSTPSQPIEGTVRIPISGDPSSLDPRLVRDLPTITILNLLYEGLTKQEAQGQVALALAKEVDISKDGMTYTFILRPASWSDGTAITARDFEETWKSLLAPDFPAPNAYQLFMIKNAKNAKEGLIALNDVGIQSLAEDRLLVQLEQPCPWFLQLVACHFCLPVHPTMRVNPATAKQSETLIGNGPFTLSSWSPRNEFLVEKNPLYWDQQAVSLKKISFQVLDETTALQLFSAGKLEWAGSPLSTLPQDAIAPLKDKQQLRIAPAAGTQWFRFNTQAAPFHDARMRRAFSLALNRQEIAEHITQGGQTPAIGIVPPVMGVTQQHYFKDHNTAEARRLFEESLSESEHPPLRVTLIYAANDRNHKIAQAVQQQWNTVFGDLVQLQGSEAQLFLDSVRSGSYQIALGSWFADISDPLNFLEIFKTKERATNQTNWEDPTYQELLDRSTTETDPARRATYLAEAEKLLIDATPVAPLLHCSYNYLASPQVEGIHFSELGHLDFKHATLNETN